MLAKTLKWAIVGLVVLVTIFVGGALLSSALSLDRDRLHTARTAELPAWPATSDAGLTRISANGFEFRARITGNEPGAPTVILLHGFPVTSAMWLPIIEPLTSAGYRVIAFDQRGYSPGARPKDPAAYMIPNLVSDVVAVADATQTDRFHLVGHDWGSAVGWSVVMAHPQRILSWTGISIAHPAAFAAALESDPDQQSRSGYFTLFTLPVVPETLFTLNNLMVLMGAYSGMQSIQQDEYRAVFSEPGALTAALNWYRQMAAGLRGARDVEPDINTPTLFIWGDNDPSAGRFAVDTQAEFMKGPYRKLELAGGHWLITSHGAQIMDAILEHLNSVENPGL